MLRCWQEEPSLRPSFSELSSYLSELLHPTGEMPKPAPEESDYVNLFMMVDLPSAPPTPLKPENVEPEFDSQPYKCAV